MSAGPRVKLMINLTDGTTGELIGQEFVYVDELDKRAKIGRMAAVMGYAMTTITLGEDA